MAKPMYNSTVETVPSVPSTKEERDRILAHIVAQMTAEQEEYDEKIRELNDADDLAGTLLAAANAIHMINRIKEIAHKVYGKRIALDDRPEIVNAFLKAISRAAWNKIEVIISNNKMTLNLIEDRLRRDGGSRYDARMAAFEAARSNPLAIEMLNSKAA